MKCSGCSKMVQRSHHNEEGRASGSINMPRLFVLHSPYKNKLVSLNIILLKNITQLLGHPLSPYPQEDQRNPNDKRALKNVALVLIIYLEKVYGNMIVSTIYSATKRDHMLLYQGKNCTHQLPKCRLAGMSKPQSDPRLHFSGDNYSHVLEPLIEIGINIWCSS